MVTEEKACEDCIIYEDTNHSKIQLRRYIDNNGDENIDIILDVNSFTGKYLYGLTKKRARKLAKEIMKVFKIDKEIKIKSEYKKRWLK